MTKLFSISGLILESFPDPSPFGGYLLQGMDYDREKEFDGMLIDNYGSFDIVGELTEETVRKKGTIL